MEKGGIPWVRFVGAVNKMWLPHDMKKDPHNITTGKNYSLIQTKQPWALANYGKGTENSAEYLHLCPPQVVSVKHQSVPNLAAAEKIGLTI